MASQPESGAVPMETRSEPEEVQWRRSRNCGRCNGNPGRRAGTKSDLRHAVRPYF